MSYSLHQSILRICNELESAYREESTHPLREVLDGELATAYVFAKELELHGYAAFCELASQYGKGEKE